MSDSALGLGGEVGDGAWWASEPVVEVDAGGEGEQALGDAGAEVSQGAGAVSFEAEEVFAGPEDRLDPLSQRRQMRASLRFGLAGRAQHGAAELADGVGELAAGVAFVGDHGLPAAQGGGQHAQRDLAFGAVGADEHRGARGAVGGKDGMQAHPVKPAAVAAAVAVGGGIGDRVSRLESPARLTVSLDRAVSTGVESINTTSSQKPGHSRASTPITCSI